MASRSTPYILALTFLGVLTLLWLVYFDNVVPMKSERVVAVEGLAIGEASHVVVTREMCFSEPSEPTAIRLYQRREEPNGIGTRDLGEEIIPSPPLIVHFDQGCNVRSRRLDLPDGIQPGSYQYRAGLKFCNDIGRCKVVWLTPLDITVIGEGPKRLIRVKAGR